MDTDNQLPPLPPSDPVSLQHNSFDSFYGVRAKDFWSENEVTYHKVEDFKVCDHNFYKVSDGQVECQRCHLGYLGVFEVKDGKLYLNGELLPI